MPGTGKSSTVSFIVRCLVALGGSVLITSHTHSAVDTVLLKVTRMERETVSI
jgi:DNA replication ATP-dependent helicase Dna2